ncbi:MAG: hypothetical protein AUJ96_17135 [Armatimonadetes bacterium CG2_30_66_41]|nr:MAG: hypothetical protein AUJ96_17135 [Armatimonadetes bacterium CG2_30_66_41]
MTKQIRAGIVALLLSLSAGAAENVGMLTELHGAVQLASAETADWTSATLMKAVSVGDKLRTPAGATVTVVFFANGKREQLQAGCLAVVQTAGCKVETGPQPNTTTVLSSGQVSDRPETLDRKVSKGSGDLSVRGAAGSGDPRRAQLSRPPGARWKRVRSLSSSPRSGPAARRGSRGSPWGTAWAAGC